MQDRITAEIRAEMARQNVNRRQLAELIGQRVDYIGRRLSGRSRLSITDLEQIARALGRTPQSFMPPEE